MSGVTLNKAVKKYGQIQVIHGVDLKVEPGEFCVFVGPSGCGKSTLLRMIAGLEETTSGQIKIGDRDVTNVDAADRGIAMVFQTYALYPHMTVEANMGFGLKMGGLPKAEVKAKVDEVAKILQLGDYMDRKPKALSGGQRQRVAIGRALVRGPEVFLFDEPLSNLDAELRVDMRVEIARLHQEIGATMIYVTHDQVEAMTLADKIVVLRAGIIEQVGAPMELYKNPDNKFVAGFIGSPSMNFIKGQSANGMIKSDTLKELGLNAPKDHSGEVYIGLRPEHIEIDTSGDDLTVDIVEQLGGVSYIYSYTKTNERLIIEAPSGTDIKRGDKIGIKFNAENVYLFDVKTELRLRA
ncbi:MAG: sn-glycerol-3-phosphate ABC transporter ATP-binding protein UgpC [Rhizobiales bacterium]|nr:sn-glycerol-3-phosphate ABC transporter ATP-binding protein UgpC [Hyphomicrobiales bacterium]NRB14521.1 sn-glycerol-3-phosphate ABC transporter ATP-binding protein UgpC [Hyphomicrobiales bacterium]